MDLVRQHPRTTRLTRHEHATRVLVLEIGNERRNFEACLPARSKPPGSPTSAGARPGARLMTQPVACVKLNNPGPEVLKHRLSCSVLNNVSLRRGVEAGARQGQRHAAARREDRPRGPQRRGQVERCSRCSQATGCRSDAGEVTDAAALVATRRHGRGGAGSMPETDRRRPPTSCSKATRRLMRLAQAALVAEAEAADDGHAIAVAHHDDPAMRVGFDARAACAGAADGPGLSCRPARRPGQQLLGRLAHAPAAGTRPDVPGRPDAARRADQPPGPGRARLARSLAAEATKAR